MTILKGFPYKNILVLGLAKSGNAAARLLYDSGLNVIVNDLKANDKDPIVQQLKQKGIEVVTGPPSVDLLHNIELIVKNPGIPYENELLVEAAKRNIPIITEIELAGRLFGENVTGITGSNGKTTTTTLLYEMLNYDGKEVKTAGNIGNVASEVARYSEPDDYIVMELSSFQLQGIETFRPKVSILLNLFEAHLDYHKTFEKYKSAKSNIFMNQRSDDYIIYNAEDSEVVELVKAAKAEKIPFSSVTRMENGGWADEEYIYFKDELVVARKDIVLVGKHNLENILAATCAAKLNGVSNESIQAVLSTFTGVKHRLQYVTTIQERAFYNDSKATNILATTKALSAFQQPVILLAGGLDRGNEFEELAPYLSHVKAMVLFGETVEKLRKTGENANVKVIRQAENMEEAVNQAFQLSNQGDVILLSPACASWDQYSTFEERGEIYMSAVKKLS